MNFRADSIPSAQSACENRAKSEWAVANSTARCRGSLAATRPQMTAEIPQLLTLFAVAKALCVSKDTVRAWVRQGRLHPVRICRRLLFTPDEINRFLRRSG
jgi:excisionase family DNA binding protein